MKTNTSRIVGRTLSRYCTSPEPGCITHGIKDGTAQLNAEVLIKEGLYMISVTLFNRLYIVYTPSPLI